MSIHARAWDLSGRPIAADQTPAEARFWIPWRQFLVYGAVALGFVGVAALVPRPAADYFTRYLGNLNPVLSVSAAAVIGAASLFVLLRLGGYQIFTPRSALRGTAHSARVVSFLAVAVVVADLFIRYPEDTNAPLPGALLFYPAIGFVAEVVFHLAPLAVVTAVLWPLNRRMGRERVIWIAIAIVAVSEPTFQVTFAGTALTWADMYTWTHVLVFAILQFRVFRRFGFVPMYVFRLIYYLFWHVIWGAIRLEVLFPG